MFTGIVEDSGIVKRIIKKSDSVEIVIESKIISEDLKIGDSVAVNGVCLTATKIIGNEFSADIMAESIKRSNLFKLIRGERVNLERAMKLNDRFGGHILTGHIDGTGEIKSIKKEGIAIWYGIRLEEKLMRYMVEKGSVSIDGISLTIAKVSKDKINVSVIPHTQKNTTLYNKKLLDKVNIEIDIIAKYAEKFLGKE